MFTYWLAKRQSWRAVSWRTAGRRNDAVSFKAARESQFNLETSSDQKYNRRRQSSSESIRDVLVLASRVLEGRPFTFWLVWEILLVQIYRRESGSSLGPCEAYLGEGRADKASVLITCKSSQWNVLCNLLRRLRGSFVTPRKSKDVSLNRQQKVLVYLRNSIIKSPAHLFVKNLPTVGMVNSRRFTCENLTRCCS